MRAYCPNYPIRMFSNHNDATPCRVVVELPGEAFRWRSFVKDLGEEVSHCVNIFRLIFSDIPFTLEHDTTSSCFCRHTKFRVRTSVRRQEDFESIGLFLTVS
jgi:hypothetical protein